MGEGDFDERYRNGRLLGPDLARAELIRPLPKENPPEMVDGPPPPMDPDDPRWDDSAPPADPCSVEEPPVKQTRPLSCALGDLVGEALDSMQARAERRELPVPVPWPTLAAALGGGLWPGSYVLVGPPKAGKSQLAMQAALHAAEKGIPVLYIGLELGKVDTVARFLGLMAERKWSRLYLGNGDEAAQEIRDVRNRYAARLSDLPIRVMFSPPDGFPASTLTRLAAELVEAHPSKGDGTPENPIRPLMMILDYLQIVGGEPGSREEELRLRIRAASYRARQVARELGAVVLLVSSAAREHYPEMMNRPPPRTKDNAKAYPPDWWKEFTRLGAGNPARMMGFGKESGEVEYSADGVIVLGIDHSEQSGGTCTDARGHRWTTAWLGLAALRAQSDDTSSWIRLIFNGGWFIEPDQEGPEVGARYPDGLPVVAVDLTSQGRTRRKG